MSTATPVHPDAPPQVVEVPDLHVINAQRRRRRRGNRRVATALVVVAVVLSGIGLLAASSPKPVPVAKSKPLAAEFLDRYVVADGRVVRWDQGGDTVSEGQAYALLLAVATGNRAKFASIWKWEHDNLQLPDGLFAYHWADGHTVSNSPATDADLDTAWALVLAAQRFGVPAYRTDGLQVAAAILKYETMFNVGRLVLVAGPWARTLPYTLDVSYYSPEAMAALAQATGKVQWTQLADSSQQLVGEVESKAPSHLPADWATLTFSGVVTPEGPPSSGQPAAYGLDAQRVEVWYAADCTAGGRALAAGNWSILQNAPGQGADLAYALNGTVTNSDRNGLGLVAAAATADAAGHRSKGAALLAQARAGDHGKNYYGDAWAALGSVLLQTSNLSSCPPAPSR